MRYTARMGEMDEILEQIREACAGKTVEEIEQDISESVHAERIANPAQLAKYFYSLAMDGDDDDVSPGPDDEPQADVDQN